MTPFVRLQTAIISILFKLHRYHPEELKRLASVYCEQNPKDLHITDWALLYYHGILPYSANDWPETGSFLKICGEILHDQIDNTSENGITIRNLLGTALSNTSPIDYKTFIYDRGSGNNRLRTHYFSQPRVLKKGDVLSTGDRLLSPPREGGNGSVLLHLTGGIDGHWISIPARLPIALLVEELHAPPNLVEK